MSILGINKNIKKIVIAYLLISVFSIIFDRIYATFSHGISSNYMTLMFLYPLIGGVVIYLLFGLFFRKIHYRNLRIYFNIYNSGIAILAVGGLLKGIIGIAGTTSKYLVYYDIVGWIAVVISIICILVNLKK